MTRRWHGEWGSDHEWKFDLRNMVANWAFLNDHLNDPLQAYDRCAQESERFLRFIQEWDGLREHNRTAKLIFGFKFGEFRGQQVITQAHVAVEVGDEVYDWTARQFDPAAPVPKITSVEEFHAEWSPPGDLKKETS